MSQVEIIRRPRSWLTVWTHLNDEVVVQNINKAVNVRFSDLLEEVLIVETVPGYVFLRVIEPDQKFCDFVKSISGVGGILNVDKNPLEIIKSQVIPFLSEEQVFVKGDFVEVVIGPLSGNVGRVVEVENSIRVELEVFARLVECDFQHKEICLCKGKENNVE